MPPDPHWTIGQRATEYTIHRPSEAATCVPPAQNAVNDLMHTSRTYNPFMRFVRTLPIPALCMVVITALSSMAAADTSIWFEDARHSPAVSSDAVRALAAHVRHRLLTPNQPEEAPILPRSVRDDFYPRVVFISASDGIHQARVAVGTARGLLKAVDHAMRQLAPTEADRFEPRWLRLDLPSTILAQENIDLTRKLEYERSLFGIAFPRSSRIALLPDELIANDVVNYHQGFFIDPLRAYLALRKPAVDHPKFGLDPKNATCFRFTVQSFFMDRQELVPLYRGHRMFDRLEQNQMREAAAAAAKYLSRAVNSQGQFDYLYQPNVNKLADEYTLATHLGTVMAMADAYSVLKDPDLLTAAKNALTYAEQSIGQWTQAGQRVPAVVEAKRVSLGANAMAAAAFARIAQVSEQQAPHAERAHTFAQAIAVAQQEDGSFTQWQRFPEGDVLEVDHPDFPSQAIFALLQTHALADHRRWLLTADKAAQHVILARHKNLPTAKLPHDHWLLCSLNQLHRIQQRDLYLDHTARISRAIGSTQHRQPPFTDWLGGFYSPPGSTPTAERAQGLLAAYALLRDHGGSAHRENAAAALDSAIAAVAFELQCQFRPENAMFFKDPQRILGGFRESLTSPYIRIDFMQHNMKALLDLWRVMEHEQITGLAVPPPMKRDETGDEAGDEPKPENTNAPSREIND